MVFAAESRATRDWQLPDGTKTVTLYHDASQKLFTFDKPHNTIAAVCSGVSSFDEEKTINSLMPEFEAGLASKGRLSVENFATKMSSFFKKKWDETPATKAVKDKAEFLVGGFNKKGESSHVYEMTIPNELKPNELSNGIWMIGQHEIALRLLRGYDVELPKLLTNALSLTDKQVELVKKAVEGLELKFAWETLGLQGYVDTAMLLIRTTVDTQKLTVCERGCGGPIDIATITLREGLRLVHCKEIEAELC